MLTCMLNNWGGGPNSPSFAFTAWDSHEGWQLNLYGFFLQLPEYGWNPILMFIALSVNQGYKYKPFDCI